jgi:hypothetical protein
VRRPADDGNPVEDAVVGAGLVWQTKEGVTVALDLVTRQEAVHDGHINANRTLTKAKLVNDDCAWLRLVSRLEMLS